MNYMLVGVLFLIVVVTIAYLLYGRREGMKGGLYIIKGGKPTTGLIHLTDDNHDEVVNSPGKVVLVKYHAEWCGHCKTMAPDWQALAANNDNSRLIVADAESKDIPLALQKLGIKGFPTIKMWKDGQPYDVNVPRTVADWKSYVESNM